jgi:hypothetical protein
MGRKYDEVTRLKNKRALQGGQVTPVIVVNGKREASASKRN